MEGYWCKECEVWKPSDDLWEGVCYPCELEIENEEKEPKGEKQNG